MKLTYDLVRELAARPEGAALDFKEYDYDWAKKKAANIELAKDLMAMANSLRPSSEPARILTGVCDNGTIVGVPPESHQDDADLHQKVRDYLNRVPLFSYASVEVGSLSVGVYEIRWSERPFFPLRDAPPLCRNVPLYRNGSSTDVASPTMVLGWAREDDPDLHRLRSLEIRKFEAEARIHGHLDLIQNTADAEGVRFVLELFNDGQSAFWFDTCQWKAEWNNRFQVELDKAGLGVPDGYLPPSGTFRTDYSGLVQAGSSAVFDFTWSRLEGLEHIKEARIGVPGFSGKWANYHFVVPCRGDISGEELMVELTVNTRDN